MKKLIQLVFVYGCNIMLLFLDKITVGNFTMYVNAASKFAENMMTLIKGLVTVHQDCRYMEVYLEFMELKPTAKTGEKEASGGQDAVIKFRNVSFHYPDREEMVLKNVSAVFRPGEKISIVGMNGAGKTTFIKLLCRLLIPTAALDPYTEYEIYRKFDEISAGKTVFYISHRLGCCQLCDRILVFAGGQIAEQGSHEELKNAGGIYSRMWDAQAKFYVT